MVFRLFPWRFHFTAVDSIFFPESFSSNVLRGAFGCIFRRIAPAEYPRVFEPGAAGKPGPSGLASHPRPFVFRAEALDGKRIAGGQPFSFDFYVFLVADPLLDSFVSAFSELAWEGLGPGRGRARLESVQQLDKEGRVVSPGPPLELSLLPDRLDVSRLTIRFLTPTELKGERGIVERPEFGVVFGRARDRVSTLRSLYGEGPLDVDFGRVGERARAVRMTQCELSRVEAERRSSRTGQVHPLGGFVGEARYAGSLREFLPVLRAAEWTGIGRQTVWGKGAISVLDY